MRDGLVSVKIPRDYAGLISRLTAAFKAETGRNLEIGPSFHLEKFSHGGMSSGGIDPLFWIEKGIPLLIQRYGRAMARQAEEAPAPTEKDLDQAIEQAFRTSPEFGRWFLTRCGISSESATYAWSRSDHPWTTVEVQVKNEATGEISPLQRQGETDVLVVFTLGNGLRIALHIENKRGLGKFTKYQPEMYAIRAKKWMGKPKYGNYEEAMTVLLAPKAFLAKFAVDAAKFDNAISHEELATQLPAFAASET